MADYLGGMTLAEIESASREQPFPDHAGATPAERFVLKVSALVRIRHQKGEKGGIAIFLQSDALQSDAKDCDGAFFPLLANANDPINERVWLSNATLGAAYALNLNCSNQAAAFEDVVRAGFATLPALVIDLRGNIPIGRFYPRGLGNPDHDQDVLITYNRISEADMKACLDKAYATALATPQRATEGHAEKLWTDATKGWPAHRPEERIQAKLINQLRGRYTNHVVRSERKNDDGISDLLVFERTFDAAGNKVVINEWLLELKALTEKTETGNPIGKTEIKRRISDGLIQAISYRDSEHVLHAALCCYDMRGSDEGDQECFAEVGEHAAGESVLLWRWYLFRDSKAIRADQHSFLPSASLQR